MPCVKRTGFQRFYILHWKKLFIQDTTRVIGFQTSLLFTFVSVDYSRSKIMCSIIFGMTTSRCAIFQQITRVSTLYGNIEALSDHRKYCLVFDFLFCLNVGRIKDTTRNTIYTFKIDDTLECSLL